jgi:stearoyl-CoA desaturase (delta-9 desaturase)
MKSLTPWYKSSLFFFHLLTHASIIPMIMFATWYEWTLTLVMYYIFGCWGVAVTYHRLVSHKSFESPKWFKIIGLIWGSLGGVGSSIQWTAVHRDHHRHSDTDNDPHNPAGSWKRFFQMQFFTMLVPSSPRYVPDLLRDPLHQKFHKYYWLIHAAYAAILIAIDPFAVVYAYLVPALILWHVMSALGTFAHTPVFGTQPVSQKDKSTNLWFLGYMAFGEGWHNNHHAEASNYRFGKSLKEFDLSALIIEKIKV